MSRLLNVKQAMAYTGNGWLEVWVEADGDLPEYKDMMPVGVCLGNLAIVDGDFTSARDLMAHYNNRRYGYGMRLWTGAKPTEAQREAAPWIS